jgi:Ca-activated chloride channel homolog
MKIKIKLIVVAICIAGCACDGPSKEQKETRGDITFRNAVLDCTINNGYIAPVEPESAGTEEYASIKENAYRSPFTDPLSTFSIDVDKAGYSIVRKFINQSQLPPQTSVRIEEMINYFTYNYNAPSDGKPFSLTTELSACPWNNSHKLLLVGMKGKEMQRKEMKKGNFVFLIDVSGSMNDPDKLPLLKDAFKLFVNELRADDKVSIVVYAGAAGAVLEGATGKEKDDILESLEKLNAGGSTAGAQGINHAYALAEKFYDKNANNRVILATDGDFNVGVSSEADLVKLIEQKRDKGIYLSVIGFGDGNYKDNKMEQLADNGNGNYAYIDNIMEAKKVLVNEIGGTIETIAKDVKLQIEFNPSVVKAYRLIGYENRVLSTADFNNDKKDAGELGSGHSVTALYEIVPAGSTEKIVSIDTLKFQGKKVSGSKDEIANLKLRYKGPRKEDTTSVLSLVPVMNKEAENVSNNYKLAAAVSEFGMLLRNSEYKSRSNYEHVTATLKTLTMNDAEGYLSELQTLVVRAKKLQETLVAEK